jgi:hypothetical protein
MKEWEGETEKHKGREKKMKGERKNKEREKKMKGDRKRKGREKKNWI